MSLKREKYLRIGSGYQHAVVVVNSNHDGNGIENVAIKIFTAGFSSMY